MTIAFQVNAFQTNAFQAIERRICIDTGIIQLPIDFVMGGDVPFKDRGKTWDIPHMRAMGLKVTPSKIMSRAGAPRRR